MLEDYYVLVAFILTELKKKFGSWKEVYSFYKQ